MAATRKTAAPASLALLLAVAAAPFAQAQSNAELIAEAKQQGTIEFVWPLFGGQPEVDAMAAVFAKQHGFAPRVRATPITDIPAATSKLIQEYRAGSRASTDFIIGSETHILALTDADTIIAVDWDKLPGVPAGLGEADNRTIPIITRIPTVTYNASKVKPEDVPKTTDEFVSTKYVIATTPYGANLNILAAKEVWGAEKTTDFARRLSAKATGMMNCGQAARLITGEFDMFGLDCGSLEALKFAARGAPLRAVILRDAPILSYLFVSIPKNTQRQAIAKLFTATIMSREGQEVLARFSFGDLHKLPGSKSAGDVEKARAEGAKFIDVNYEFGRRNGVEVAGLRREFMKILERK